MNLEKLNQAAGLQKSLESLREARSMLPTAESLLDPANTFDDGTPRIGMQVQVPIPEADRHPFGGDSRTLCVWVQPEHVDQYLDLMRTLFRTQEREILRKLQDLGVDFSGDDEAQALLASRTLSAATVSTQH